ncbi:MAG: thiamine pyrophosphate-binding protein [Proteobacteria bacterium]|nr:thiamine pyrophosphate-binding protein [Pseudomonadota bacterium]
MAKMTGGQVIVRTLMGHGIDTVFGLPGVQLDNLFDALYEAKGRIRTIHTRHEQGAAYMALGYAQSSGRVGTCLAVPGPGVLNMGAALATAAGSNVPVLCLTGQIPSYQIGLGLGIAHEIRDQPQALGGIVKWVGRAGAPAEVPGVLREGFRQMLGGRHQPVAFEMAPDLMGRAAEVELLAAEPDYPEPGLSEGALASAARLLGGAEKPAIFVGSGVFGAEAELRRVAELLEAPVIMSRTGRGALSDRHHLAQGIIEGQLLWGATDVALVVGTRFLSPALAWGREKEVKVVRIDIDPEQAAKPRPADVCLVARARTGLRLLAERLEGQNRARPSRKAEMAAVKGEVQGRLARLQPQHGFATVIRDEVPDDGFLATDVTQLGTFIQHGVPIYEPRTLITPGFQATLGYAFPAGLGAKVANPERKVAVIIGDGGFMFTVQELSTAVKHGIEVVTIVFRDDAFGNVKRIQKESYGGRNIAVELANPDFVRLAESFGMLGLRARTPAELRRALREGFAARGPALIEVPVGELPDIWKLIQRPPSQGVVGGPAGRAG